LKIKEDNPFVPNKNLNHSNVKDKEDSLGHQLQFAGQAYDKGSPKEIEELINLNSNGSFEVPPEPEKNNGIPKPVKSTPKTPVREINTPP
jgi:hypothetical protein